MSSKSSLHTTQVFWSWTQIFQIKRQVFITLTSQYIKAHTNMAVPGVWKDPESSGVDWDR